MIARKQNFGNFFSLEFRRAGVLRIFEKIIRKTFVFKAVARDNSVYVAADSVGYDHCGEFSARKNVIAYRYFAVEITVKHALIHAFVMTAEKNQTIVFKEFFYIFLLETLTLGRHIYPVRLSVGIDGVHRRSDRLRHHEHPRPAAERIIVAFQVFVFAVIAYIGNVYFDFSVFGCSADNALFQRGEHIGEKR